MIFIRGCVLAYASTSHHFIYVPLHCVQLLFDENQKFIGRRESYYLGTSSFIRQTSFVDSDDGDNVIVQYYLRFINIIKHH